MNCATSMLSTVISDFSPRVITKFCCLGVGLLSKYVSGAPGSIELTTRAPRLRPQKDTCDGRCRPRWRHNQKQLGQSPSPTRRTRWSRPRAGISLCTHLVYRRAVYHPRCEGNSVRYLGVSTFVGRSPFGGDRGHSGIALRLAAAKVLVLRIFNNTEFLLLTLITSRKLLRRIRSTRLR